jgi:Tfp pilus assembly protein PilF
MKRPAHSPFRFSRAKTAALAATVFGSVLAGGWLFKDTLAAAMDARHYEKARRLASERRYGESRNLVKTRKQNIGKERERLWLRLAARVAAALKDFQELVWIYRVDERAVLANESSSLWLARIFASKGEPDRARALAAAWRDGAEIPEGWLALEADRLLAAGEFREARKILLDTEFEGKRDVGRLARLAMLSRPSESWRLLREAEALDTRNAYTHLMKARLLERHGHRKRARLSFITAAAAAPRDPLFADQLGDFYRRGRRFDLAIQAWNSGNERARSELLLVKALFWAKVARTPAETIRSSSEERIDTGRLSRVMAELPNERFWEPARGRDALGAHELDLKRGESQWLSILERLRTGNEGGAFDKLLYQSARAQSLEPGLAADLLEILARRLRRPVPPEVARLRKQVDTPRSAPITDRLKKKDPSVLKLVQEDEIFALAAVSHGWFAAGLKLSRLDRYPDRFPDWAAFSMTQALRAERGPEQALAFAKRQRPFPALRLAIAEVAIAQGGEEDARRELDALARLPGPTGRRAASLLALGALETKDAARVKRVLALRPELRGNRKWEEIRARAHLLEGDLASAERAYRSIAKDSAESMRFLFGRAVSKGDSKAALKWAIAFHRKMPDAVKVHTQMNQALEELERSSL